MKYSTLDSGIEFPMGRGKSSRVVSPDVGASQITLNLSIFEAGDEFPQHIHDISEDCFIVLDGSVSLREGETYTPLQSGQAVWIPVGEVHGTYNHSGHRAELISFQSPPDVALYRGDREGGHAELPAPSNPALSRVITLSEEVTRHRDGDAVFGGTVRSAVDAERHAEHLAVEHITLQPGGRLEIQPDENEHIVILLEGGARAIHSSDDDLSPRSILYGAPVEGLDLIAGEHGAVLLHSRAQVSAAPPIGSRASSLLPNS
jgi:quercetin dioxygenase-like cupin family protein